MSNSPIRGSISRSDIEINIPSISQLLIVGASDTSIAFSANIQNIGQFDRVYHVESIKNAANLLTRVKFGVVVIDADSEIDPISFTRSIRLYNSQARIVVIASKMERSRLFNLKNKGSIHGFLSIPIDDILAHTLIVQEQAKYQVNIMLNQLVADPPRFTPAYLLLHDRDMVTSSDLPYEIVGFAIIKETIPIYDHIFSENIDMDTTLLSSYLSAISILGQNLFDKKEHFEEINFEGISIYFHFLEELQFVYFVKNITRENYKAVEDVIKRISNRIYLRHGQELLTETYIDDELEVIVTNLVERYLPKEVNQDAREIDYKSKIINYGEASDKLLQVYDETQRVYHVEYIADDDQLYDFVKSRDIDIIIFNHYEEMIQETGFIIKNCKELSPATQIIVIIEDNIRETMLKVLNNSMIDYALEINDRIDRYYEWIKAGISRSKKIRAGSEIKDENLYYRSYDQIEIIKEMLRRYQMDFDTTSVPELYGIYILKEDIKFYSNLWIESDRGMVKDDELFAGFITALTTFTGEFRESVYSLSGVRFGDANILIEVKDKFTFIYLVGNLDVSNYEAVNQLIEKITEELYTEIEKTQNDQDDQTDELVPRLNRIGVEMALKMGNLDFK